MFIENGYCQSGGVEAVSAANGWWWSHLLAISSCSVMCICLLTFFFLWFRCDAQQSMDHWWTHLRFVLRFSSLLLDLFFDWIMRISLCLRSVSVMPLFWIYFLWLWRLRFRNILLSLLVENGAADCLLFFFYWIKIIMIRLIWDVHLFALSLTSHLRSSLMSWFENQIVC